MEHSLKSALGEQRELKGADIYFQQQGGAVKKVLENKDLFVYLGTVKYYFGHTALPLVVLLYNIFLKVLVE